MGIAWPGGERGEREGEAGIIVVAVCMRMGGERIMSNHIQCYLISYMFAIYHCTRICPSASSSLHLNLSQPL